MDRWISDFDSAYITTLDETHMPTVSFWANSVNILGIRDVYLEIVPHLCDFLHGILSSSELSEPAVTPSTGNTIRRS